MMYLNKSGQATQRRRTPAAIENLSIHFPLICTVIEHGEKSEELRVKSKYVQDISQCRSVNYVEGNVEVNSLKFSMRSRRVEICWWRRGYDQRESGWKVWPGWKGGWFLGDCRTQDGHPSSSITDDVTSPIVRKFLYQPHLLMVAISQFIMQSPPSLRS